MVSLGDLNMIFETAGNQAVSQGADKAAGSIDKVRKSLSSYGEMLGKVESQITFLRNTLVGMGISSFTQGNLAKSIFGDDFAKQSTFLGETLGAINLSLVVLGLVLLLVVLLVLLVVS